MRKILRTFWAKLNESYWFIPSAMAVMAMLLSIATIRLDEVIGRDLGWLGGLVYVDSAAGAREVLSTVASSMITVAGVVFSLTMVVLSLTSQQYGPMALNHFMHDRVNQFVLGVFTATFLYCLLVLRTIRGGEETVFIPNVSVLAGLLLAIASLAVLIYFIHHISSSIQAPNIIARISGELRHLIDRRFPTREALEKAPSHDTSLEQAVSQRMEQEGSIVSTSESGYLQMIDDEALMKMAHHHDVIVHLDVQPGQFLFKGQLLVRILPPGSQSEAIDNAVQDAFIFGVKRTENQDIEYVIMQLSALAVRALSPGINDPYTAVMVIDHLSEGLCFLLSHQQPSRYHYDEDDRLRVITNSVAFDVLFEAAFDQIQHYGNSDPKIVIRLLHVWRTLWGCSEEPAIKSLLYRHAIHLYEESKEKLSASENEQVSQEYVKLSREFAHIEQSGT